MTHHDDGATCACLESEDRFTAVDKREQKKSELRKKLRTEFLSHSCRVAEPSDYEAWLRGYIKIGGRVSHHYDYPLPTQMCFVLKCDGAFMPALFGALSLMIIVPKGLGIRFVDTVGPHITYRGDGEWRDCPAPIGWRDMLNMQAARIGWATPYPTTPES